jgi:hypothetical protein
MQVYYFLSKWIYELAYVCTVERFWQAIWQYTKSSGHPGSRAYAEKLVSESKRKSYKHKLQGYV